jgi:hypothetical protein
MGIEPKRARGLPDGDPMDSGFVLMHVLTPAIPHRFAESFRAESALRGVVEGA